MTSFASAAPRHDGLSLSIEGPRRYDLAAQLLEPAGWIPVMNDTPQLLLSHHLKFISQNIFKTNLSVALAE